MLKPSARYQFTRATHLSLPWLLLLIVLISSAACNNTSTTKRQTANIKQTQSQAQDANANSERLAKMESDVNFLLTEVSKMSDLGELPQFATTRATPKPRLTDEQEPVTNNLDVQNVSLKPNDQTPVNNSSPITAPVTNHEPTQAQLASHGTPAEQEFRGRDHSSLINPKRSLCPAPFTNTYQKSFALARFPRAQASVSNLGALHQVDQHLPLLIGENLRNRHAMLTPVYLAQSFTDANNRGELETAAQAVNLARQNRVQFLISGAVNDMALSFPNSVIRPSHYTRFISGVHNFLHINTKLDKRNRVFSFTLHVRDGVTGQTVFSEQYQTFGKWKPTAKEEVGFSSPRFWLTDYGKQIQQLVASASDDLARVLDCQPYLTRVDFHPGQKNVVLQSGANSGVRVGEVMELYQLVQQPVTGEYQKFDTRLIKANVTVHVTEVYPNHSVGRVDSEVLLNGQYFLRAF